MAIVITTAHRLHRVEVSRAVTRRVTVPPPVGGEETSSARLTYTYEVSYPAPLTMIYLSCVRRKLFMTIIILNSRSLDGVHLMIDYKED